MSVEEQERGRVGAGTGNKAGKDHTSRLDRARESVELGRPFESERLATEALRAAAARRDFGAMAEAVSMLKAARSRKRDLAAGAKKLHRLNDPSKLEEALARPRPGLWLVAPPLVGADGRRLREAATERKVAALVVVREPTTRTGLWPVVMIGPVTVRTKVQAPEDDTPNAAWFFGALDALGDEAIAMAPEHLPAEDRAEQLIDTLLTLEDGDRLHDAVIAACSAAAAERTARSTVA